MSAAAAMGAYIDLYLGISSPALGLVANGVAVRLLDLTKRNAS